MQETGLLHFYLTKSSNHPSLKTYTLSYPPKALITFIGKSETLGLYLPFYNLDIRREDDVKIYLPGKRWNSRGGL